MDDFETILKRVPAERRDAVLAWWNGMPDTHHDRALRDLGAKYPGTTIESPQAVADVTRTPALPMMAAPSTLEAEGAGPKIPLANLPRPGAVRAFGNAVLNSLPFADEAVAGTTSLANRILGREDPGYETNRRLAEYQLGRGALDHPMATGLGTAAGLVGAAGLVPGASAEELATKGAGRVLARGIGEGGAYGAVYGAGASDPGNRGEGALVGGITGTLTAGALGLAGETAAHFSGSPAGRKVRSLAEAGHTPLRTALSTFTNADPEAPLVVADVIGPFGPSQVRAAAVTPGEGQSIIQRTLRPREAGRPGRILDNFQRALETSQGSADLEVPAYVRMGSPQDFPGLRDAAREGTLARPRTAPLSLSRNPVTVAREMLGARSEEAERLFNGALMPNGEPIKLDPAATTPLLRVPQVRDLIDEYRAIHNEDPIQTNALGLNTVTGPELQYARRRLNEMGQHAAVGNPAKGQAVGRSVRNPAEAVTRVLETIPGYTEANQAFAQQSRLMEAQQLGSRALQTSPFTLEDALLRMGPEERQMAQLNLPSSVDQALQGGTARGALSRLGLGQSPRVGRQRAIDMLLPSSAHGPIDRMVQTEELMLPSEAAANAATNQSATVPNQLSLGDAYLTGGLSGIRGHVYHHFRNAPNPEQLAADARILTASGARGRRILQEAVESQAAKGQARRGFNLAQRLTGAAFPTVSRLDTDAERAAQQDELDRLIQMGMDEETARRRVQNDFAP